MWGGVRFTLGAAIPSGATINSATFELYIESDSGWNTSTDYLSVWGTDSSDAGQCTSTATRPSIDGGSTALTTSVRWPASGGFSPGTNSYKSIDIAAIIQELVDDNGGLANGAHIAIWHSHGSPSGDPYIWCSSYSRGASYRQKLTIDYTESAGGGVVIPIFIKQYRARRT